jgi:hypothetical protein
LDLFIPPAGTGHHVGAACASPGLSLYSLSPAGPHGLVWQGAGWMGRCTCAISVMGGGGPAWADSRRGPGRRLAQSEFVAFSGEAAAAIGIVL